MTGSVSPGGNGRTSALGEALGETLAATEWLRSAYPGDLDKSADCLERAVRAMDSYRAPSDGAETGARSVAELEILRGAVRRAGVLLEHAAGFYAGWERKRGELMAGYTARGDAATPTRTSTFHISG